MELLTDFSGWKAKVFDHNGNEKGVEAVAISYISYALDSGDIVQAFHLDPNDPTKWWDRLVAQAKSYKYAEQVKPSKTEDFKQWPWSSYMLAVGSFTDVAVNSNTFIRHVVTSVGLQMIELPGSHPGSMKAEDKPYFNQWKANSPPFKP
jgi:hypothetical protein